MRYRRGSWNLALFPLVYKKNLLTVNWDKTRFLTFSLTGANKPQNQTITLHSCPSNLLCNCPSINQTDQIKYLGIIVDDRLHWDKHTVHLTLRLRKLIYKFVQLRRVLPSDILKNVYYALIESTLSYGILAWGGSYYTHISCLTRTQKLILRILNFKPNRYPSKLLFKEYEVLSIRQIFINKILLYIHKHPEHTITVAHRHHTRTRNTNLSLPRMATALGQRHAMYLATKIYNIIPLHLKSIQNYKTEMKKWLIERDIDTAETLIKPM